MLSGLALVAFAAAGLAWLTASVRRDQRAAGVQRRILLDPLAGLLADSRITLAEDGFPRLAGRLPDRRQVTVELIADTLVVRRLPQLWLAVTVAERRAADRPQLAALARPTGAEFYARTYDLPARLDHPLSHETGLLIRGDDRLDQVNLDRCCAVLEQIFFDAQVKEIVVTGRGVRVIRQAAEGDRGAHLLLRQARFPVAAISAEAFRSSLAAVDLLRDALDLAAAPRKLSA